jgi:serine/threonine protein kinase
LNDTELHRFRRISVVPLDAVSHPPTKSSLPITPWPATEFEVLIPFVGRCVQKVRRRDSGIIMACKTITWHRQSRRSEVIRAWRDISAIDHANIVQCYGIHTLPDLNRANILMEFCEGGSLDVIRERMSKLGRTIEEVVLGRLAEGVCHAPIVPRTFILICVVTDSAGPCVSSRQEDCSSRHSTTEYIADNRWHSQIVWLR